MPVKFGNTTASFRLGASAASKVAIGGTEVWSNVSAPTAPLSPALAVNGPQTLHMQWATPESDGGSEITGYVITYTITSGINSGITATATVGPAIYEYTIDGTSQVNGTEYSVTVAATNAIGTGTATSPLTAATADVPGEPSWSTAATSASPGSIDTTFSAPMINGGSPITTYEMEYDTDNTFSTALAIQFPESPFTLAGLQGGQAYYLRLRAVNAAGNGAWVSFPSNPVSASATVPGTPEGLAVNPDYLMTTWSLSWTEPFNGGSAITSYEFEEVNSDYIDLYTDEQTGTGSSYAWAVQDPDQTRNFRIRAVNSVGASEWSPWVTSYYDTPTVPGAPTITSAIWNGSQTVVDYTPPLDDGNSGITTYTVYFDGVAETPASVLSGTHYFDADYTGQDATITATNGVGEGGASAPVEVITV